MLNGMWPQIRQIKIRQSPKFSPSKFTCYMVVINNILTIFDCCYVCTHLGYLHVLLSLILLLLKSTGTIPCVFPPGTFIKEKDRCKKCKGKQVIEEDCTLDVSGCGYCKILTRPL